MRHVAVTFTMASRVGVTTWPSVRLRIGFTLRLCVWPRVGLWVRLRLSVSAAATSPLTVAEAPESLI